MFNSTVITAKPTVSHLNPSHSEHNVPLSIEGTLKAQNDSLGNNHRVLPQETSKYDLGLFSLAKNVKKSKWPDRPVLIGYLSNKIKVFLALSPSPA